MADEIMSSLFLKKEAIVGDRLLTAKTYAIQLNKAKEYIKTLRFNKVLGPDGIKVEIYQKISFDSDNKRLL